jgi:O-antigen/teichoic acid export membrane protein
MTDAPAMTERPWPAAVRPNALLPSWAGLWARDSALMLLSQGLTVVAASLSAVLVARRLAPGDWGIFSAFLGLSFALGVFVEFGLATWLLRELSRLFGERGDAGRLPAQRLVGVAIAYTVTLTVLLAASGIIVGTLAGEPLSLALTLSALLCYGGLFATANVLEPYLRAQRRLRRIVTASILEKYVLVLLVIVVVVMDAGLWAIGIAYVSAGLLRACLLGRSVFGRDLPPLPKWADISAILKKSLPFALTSGALNVVPKLDTIALLALSATAAGYFALADRILGPAVVAAVVAATTLYPFLARRVHGRRAIWALALGFGGIGAIIAAAGIVAAPSLVPLIFGRKYDGAVTAVRLMLLALPLVYAANPLQAYGFSYGRERAVVFATISVTFVGTGAILAGQALEGVSGAAVGFLVRQALMFSAIVAIAAVASRSDRSLSPLPLGSRVEAPVP